MVTSRSNWRCLAMGRSSVLGAARASRAFELRRGSRAISRGFCLAVMQGDVSRELSQKKRRFCPFSMAGERGCVSAPRAGHVYGLVILSGACPVIGAPTQPRSPKAGGVGRERATDTALLAVVGYI